MKRTLWSILLIGILLVLCLSACVERQKDVAPAVTNAEATAEQEITNATATNGGESVPTPKPTEATDMANPASVYCEQQGGVVEIRTDAQGGQSGVCVFADGSECDEWAFFRGECQPGVQAATPVQPARYSNDAYGFSLNPSQDWTLQEFDHHLLLSKEGYRIFFGFRRADEEVIFRTGMPSGDFVDGGTFKFMGDDVPKKLLVAEGKTKLVEYGAGLEASDLRLYIWLEKDPDAPGAGDYLAIDIPAEVIAAVDEMMGTFTLQRR